MIFRSVSSRLATWMLLGSTLVLSVTGAALLEHTRRQVLAQTHREALALAHGTAARIGARVGEAVSVTRVLRGVLPGRQPDAATLLPDVLRSHPDLSGIAVAFAAPGQMASTAIVVVRETGGTIARLDLGQDSVRAWYASGLACGDGCWQRPFMAGSRGGSVVGFFQPMQGGVGVVSSELSLGWLQSLLATLPEPPGGYAFVMDRGGTMLAHERPGFVGTQASDFLQASIIRGKGAPMRLTAGEGARVDEPSWAYVTPIEGTPWLFGLVIPEARIVGDVRRVFLLDIALGLIGLLVLSAVILVLSRRLLAPLSALTRQAERIAAGDTGQMLTPSPAHDEVGRLSRSFEEMRAELAVHIEAVAAGSRASERLASELDIARSIQLSMVPAPTRNEADFSLCAYLQPAQAVGGDLYFYLVQADRIWLMVGDVSDKGVAAALFMARVITLARTLARDAATPDQLLAQLNAELAPDNEACMFVTLVCATVDRATGSVLAASAGHEPPLRCRGDDCSPLMVTGGPPLGLERAAHWPLAAATLLPGDQLLMYSDGITEADDGMHEFFGDARLFAAMRGPAGQGGSERVSRLLEAVSGHVGGYRQSDDIALLALQWQGRPMQQPFRQRIAPTRDAVFAVLDIVQARARDAGAGGGTQADVRLAAEELLVNLVEHSTATRIDISLEASARGLQLHILDDGQPFDPLTPPAAVNDGQVGGLGLHLVHQLATGARSERLPDGNTVTLQFDFPTLPTHEGP